MELIGSIPLLGGFLSTIIAFVAMLSVIIFIHEYGHYRVGRACGIHAEVFSMGFGPILTSWVDRRGTRWQLAAFPFGGYVKFLGDADAASGVDSAALEGMDGTEKRRTLQGASLMARTLTVAAGPFANFILSIGIFSVLIFLAGQPSPSLKIGELVDVPGVSHDLRVGDEILAINGQDIETYEEFSQLASKVDVTDTPIYTVRRDDHVMDLPGPFPILALVDGMTPRSPAIDAGVEIGDLILAVDGAPITAFWQLQKAVQGSNAEPLDFLILRGGQEIEMSFAPKSVDMPLPEGGFEQRILIGISGSLFFERETLSVGPFTSLYYGVLATWNVIYGSIDGLWNMIAGAISACNLQGPVGIAKTAGDMASMGVGSFVHLIAVLSTAIGLLNLFPIPVLDGGHLVFFAYEAVTRRKPNERALQIMMNIGLFVIISLMVFALGNDFFC